MDLAKEHVSSARMGRKAGLIPENGPCTYPPPRFPMPHRNKEGTPALEATRPDQ